MLIRVHTLVALLYPITLILMDKVVVIEGSGKVVRKQRWPTAIKVLPADESLLHDFASEDVEERLGKVRIQTRNNRLRRDHVTVRETEVGQSQSNVNEARVNDLEEIFKILARRDGYFHEQMLSLWDSIGKINEILNQVGISNMNPEERDAIIKKVLETSVNTYGRKYR